MWTRNMELSDCRHRIASRWESNPKLARRDDNLTKINQSGWSLLIDYQAARMGKSVGPPMGSLLVVAILFNLLILFLHVRPAIHLKSPDNSSTRASSASSLLGDPLLENISLARTSIREHTMMGQELMDSIEDEQLAILFPNGVRNITKQVPSATVKKNIYRTVQLR